MKRIFAALLCAALLTGLLAACSKTEESTTQAPPASEVGTVAADVSEPEEETETSQPEAEETDEEEPPAGETPAPDRDLNELYETIADAAGLAATLDVTMLDLNAGGGITTDNILDMAAGQSKVGGDSGLVLVLYVENGTVDTMVEELQAYRDSLISGPNYDEFADAKSATEDARIEAFGNYVIYAAISVDAGASYEDVDAVLADLFA